MWLATSGLFSSTGKRPDTCPRLSPMASWIDHLSGVKASRVTGGMRGMQSSGMQSSFVDSSNDQMQDYLCFAEDRDCIEQAGQRSISFVEEVHFQGCNLERLGWSVLGDGRTRQQQNRKITERLRGNMKRNNSRYKAQGRNRFTAHRAFTLIAQL
jgi:hypothetical protein